MVILGLVLIGLGALAIVAAVFATEITAGQVQYLGIDVSPLVLFLIGLASALAVLWGLGILRVGSRRSMARRRERKRLTELSAKLDQVEAERRQDADGREGPVR